MADSRTHLEVKFFVDKKTNTLLFAESGGDFVDVLYSFLTLPLGTIARLIGKTQSEPTSTDLGCFTTLSQSVHNLEPEYFRAVEFKDVLLHPRSSSEDKCRKLKINIDDTEANYFLCPNRHDDGNCKRAMSIYKNTICSSRCCERSMSVLKVIPLEDNSKGNVFVTRASKFIVTDDLQVTPVVLGTVIGFLNNLGIKDMNALERTTVKLSKNEVIELLKLTFFSATPLTDLFVSKTKQHVNNSMPKTLSLPERDVVDLSSWKDVDVKVVVRNSNKEFLFVEAGYDFIDFLFSLLLIPLGEALHLMEGESGLGCIDGLYNSAQSLDSQYIWKNSLLRPKLPPVPLDSHRMNILFPLETTELRCSIDGDMKTMPTFTNFFGVDYFEGFVRNDKTFMVFDNLALTPFSLESIMSVCNREKLSFSDLEERSLSIGIAEGISILRASLNSTSAISNGLLYNSSLIFKEPKEEK